eukprot:2048955-Pyramimonas_sp.AAC.1
MQYWCTCGKMLPGSGKKYQQDQGAASSQKTTADLAQALQVVTSALDKMQQANGAHIQQQLAGAASALQQAVAATPPQPPKSKSMLVQTASWSGCT